VSAKPPITGITFDSWAVMAWLQGEPAGVFVRDLIDWCDGKPEAGESVISLLQGVLIPPRLFLSIINLGEVFYLLGRRKGEKTAWETIRKIKMTSIEIVSIPDDLVLKAAAIKMKYPVSYADAFAVATAKGKNSLLMTGDPEIKGINEVDILWIGQDLTEGDS